MAFATLVCAAIAITTLVFAPPTTVDTADPPMEVIVTCKNLSTTFHPRLRSVVYNNTTRAEVLGEYSRNTTVPCKNLTSNVKGNATEVWYKLGMRAGLEPTCCTQLKLLLTAWGVKQGETSCPGCEIGDGRMNMTCVIIWRSKV